MFLRVGAALLATGLGVGGWAIESRPSVTTAQLQAEVAQLQAYNSCLRLAIGTTWLWIADGSHPAPAEASIFIDKARVCSS